MILSLIVAASENNVIGVGNALPWKLPDDLKHFKELTIGHPIIMGRKTYESIGRLLPDRVNIIITRNKDFAVEGAVVVDSIDQAIEEAKKTGVEEIFIIGGAEIYKQTMDSANRIYLTRVNTRLKGDAFFPEIDDEKWKEVPGSRQMHPKDDTHEHSFVFITFERVQPL